MKYTYGTIWLMNKMNEELKAKGYKTKCYRSPLGSWVVEVINQNKGEKNNFMDIEKTFKHTESISETSKKAIAEIERSFVETAKYLCDLLPDSREKSLFLTKYQEAKFWAVECVAKNQD